MVLLCKRRSIDANQCNEFGSFRYQNLMHDQVRRINMFSSAFLFKISFQKTEQLGTWLIEDRLIHLHTKLFFSIKSKINLSATIRNICIHRYSLTPKMNWL